MRLEEIYEVLSVNLVSSKIYINEPMYKHTTFKIGGPADIFVVINTLEDLKYVVDFSKNNNIPIKVIGNGSNLLVKDSGIRGIALKLNFDNIEILENELKVKVLVGAGVKIGRLSRELLNKEIAGFEFASGIPGTIGGAVRMNAGAYGKEIKDILISTKYMDSYGNIHVLKNSEHEFKYRKSIFKSKDWIILESILELEKGSKENIEELIKKYSDSRKDTQPVDKSSAGSTFKRGEDFITAKLIDDCGLKGYSIGDAKVSEKHAGFIINNGNAKAKDILDLIEYIKQKVYEKYGKNIELEIEVIGED